MNEQTCQTWLPGGSLLGPEHEMLARRMTSRAAMATAAVCAVIALLCMPLVLALPLVVTAYMASEAVFVVLYCYRYLLLSYQPIKHRPLSHDPIAALQRTLQHLQQDGADIRTFLSIWFHGAPVDTIKRGNVKDLIAYAFWYKTPSEVAAEGHAEQLEQQVASMEAMWGLTLTPGYDPQLTCMAHLWEPMKHWYKPLAFYAAMEVAALLCRVALHAAGFQRNVTMGLACYSMNLPSPPRRWSSDVAAGGCSNAGRGCDLRAAQNGGGSSQQVPLVLLHGIGMGLIPYISMLFNMAATGRPVLALELPHVSQRWVLWVPTVDEVAEVVVSILDRNALHSCCLVGHSYGTAAASRLLQQAPHRIQQLCLIDPICFTMFMPNLLRNFLYESPQSGSLLGDFMMTSAARDLHVSATLSRKFFWSDVNLWEEQLPAGTLVVLSGRDALMAAPQVRSWLEEHTQALVMYHPQLAHAGFLLDIPWQQQILQQLFQLLDHQGSPSSTPATQQPPGDGQQGRVPSQGGDPSHSTGLGGKLQGGSAGHGAAAPGRPLADLQGRGYTNVAHGPAGGFNVQAGAVTGTAPVAHHNHGLDASQRHVGASGSRRGVRSSGSSDSGSQYSFQSCCGGSSDTGSSSGRSPAARMACDGQQQHQHQQQHQQLPAQPKAASWNDTVSPFSASAAAFQQQASPDKGARVTLLPAAAWFGKSSSYGSLRSYGSLGSNSTGGHLQPNGSIRSEVGREGSLELTSPLCMRSWSGVLPANMSAAWATDTSTGSAENSLVPESPRSVNTFVSASSVQSRRSQAAAAAAQEARHAAQALLQPLLALQQRKQRPWGAAGVSGSVKAHDGVPGQHVTAEGKGGGDDGAAAAVPAATAPAPAGSIDCLVSYASCASAGDKQDKQAAPVQSTATANAGPGPVGAECAAVGSDRSQPDSSTFESAAGAASEGQSGSLGLRLRAGFGRRSRSLNMGVLKRVEGFLQGRGTRAGDGAGSGIRS